MISGRKEWGNGFSFVGMGRETLRQGHSGNDSGRDLKVKLEMARGRVEVGGQERGSQVEGINQRQ